MAWGGVPLVKGRGQPLGDGEGIGGHIRTCTRGSIGGRAGAAGAFFGEGAVRHWKGGRPPPPLQGAQAVPSHRPPDGKRRFYWRL